MTDWLQYERFESIEKIENNVLALLTGLLDDRRCYQTSIAVTVTCTSVVLKASIVNEAFYRLDAMRLNKVSYTWYSI